MTDPIFEEIVQKVHETADEQMRFRRGLSKEPPWSKVLPRGSGDPSI